MQIKCTVIVKNSNMHTHNIDSDNLIPLSPPSQAFSLYTNVTLFTKKWNHEHCFANCLFVFLFSFKLIILIGG